MEGKLTLARLDCMCIMEGTASGKGPRALDLRKGSRMASKNSVKTAEKIVADYIKSEREKMDAELVTSNAYDDFVKAARLINKDITDEELDEIFSKHYNACKYANAAVRWFDDSKHVDEVIDNAAAILDAMQPIMTPLSESDILMKAGFSRQRWDKEFNVRVRRAFNLLVDADEFHVTPICTCGRVHIYLYAVK